MCNYFVHVGEGLDTSIDCQSDILCRRDRSRALQNRLIQTGRRCHRHRRPYPKAVVTAAYDAAHTVRGPVDDMRVGATERATRRPGPKVVNRLRPRPISLESRQRAAPSQPGRVALVACTARDLLEHHPARVIADLTGHHDALTPAAITAAGLKRCIDYLSTKGPYLIYEIALTMG
jgi:hypothetical protein